MDRHSFVPAWSISKAVYIPRRGRCSKEKQLLLILFQILFMTFPTILTWVSTVGLQSLSVFDRHSSTFVALFFAAPQLLTVETSDSFGGRSSPQNYQFEICYNAVAGVFRSVVALKMNECSGGPYESLSWDEML